MQGINLLQLLEEQSATISNEKILVVFVGSSLSFPESLISVANGTIASHEFVRINDIPELLRTVKLGRNVALFVFEEQHISLFATQTEEFLSICGKSRIAFAYLEQESAFDLLDMRGQVGGTCEVSLFPLNSQLEVALSVIKLILCGRQFIPCELLLDRVMHKSPELNDNLVTRVSEDVLTARELEVLSLVSAGEPNKEVAYTLALSEHTVKLHMHHILRKLGVKNRTEASAWYLTSVGGGGAEAGSLR